MKSWKDLMLLAQEWIKDYSGQLSVFPDEDPNRILHLNHCLQVKVEFGELPILIQDLAVIRIFGPASKLRSLRVIGTILWY